MQASATTCVLPYHSVIEQDVYTRIGLHDQRTAIELLPAPPELRPLAKVNGHGGVDLKKPNGHANGKGQLDALWAQLPEHVKAELFTMVKAGAGSDLVAGQSG
jgi:hypothetical protein